jgi:putative ABC transport system permease protein
MLGNYIAAAFGGLTRNWLYTGITILGLAAGFAAAILVGLYVRDEYSFDRFISGYGDVYRLETDVLAPGQEPQRTDWSLNTDAPNLALAFHDVEQVARLARSSEWVGRGEAKIRERVAWADPNFFKVMPYPVLAGDPVAALHDPDGLVLTRKMARKYFGEDAPIGKTLLVQPTDTGLPPLLAASHPMRVKAVLKDIPSQHHLAFDVFASGRAAWTNLASFDRITAPSIVWTYVRLRHGASPDRVRAGLRAFAARHPGYRTSRRLRLEPLKDLHFAGGARAVDAGIAAVGALIIVIAAINFVTLMTARATRRAVEVGVRKVVGARRRDLMIQFMGEALIHVLVAMLIGVALVELTLPYVNAFLQRTITFDYLGEPALAAAILGGALLTGLLAGLYPAVVLSGFRPASALNGGGQAGGSAAVRHALVVVQFAILTCLIIVAATIWRQTSFALQNLLRLNEDQVLYIVAPCEHAFKQELAALSGVNAVTCVSGQAVDNAFPLKTFVKDSAPGAITVDSAPIDAGFFEMHGLKPLAGRFFSRDRGEDMVLDRPNSGVESQPSVVLNESAVRQLGFKTPQQAIGRSISWGRPSAAPPTGALPPFRSSRIIGVVEDFTLGDIRTRADAIMYFVDPQSTGTIFAKLDGRRLPDTLRSIDGLWRRTSHIRPIYRNFLGPEMKATYRDVEIQGAIIGACTGLAIVIACLGLFALAAFTTERRTKEIGVRKAMGADSLDILNLLVWEFTQPVLWANLIAWPLAFWAMDHWLHGFAYRVDLPPWLFLAASAAAVLIAWVTVSVHAWLVARAKPVTALRYE